MIRFFAIVLFFGLAIASGAAGYFAHMQEKQKPIEPEVAVEFEPMTAFDLIDDAPREDKAIQLTDFFYGRLPIGISLDDNKKDWEEVYIPLFAKSNRVQRHNAVCVIYRTDELRNKEDASEFFENIVLDGFYSTYQQELPGYAFSKLAQKYKSLDYSNCVLLSNKKPESLQEESTYWVALLGFAFFLSIAGWQSLALMGDMKSRIEREKRAREVRDAAGLGSLFEEADARNGISSGASPSNADTGQVSFLDKWNPDS